MLTRLLLKLESFTGSMHVDIHMMKPVRSSMSNNPPFLRIGESENPVD